MKRILIIILIVAQSSSLFASRFDELDKPPEGAHKGQMLLGLLVSFGKPYGDIVDAEHDFLSGNTYTFEETGVTKRLLVDHLSFAFGVGFEYMPFDHIGAKIKLKRTMVIQRTVFGAQYENWRGTTYSDWSVVVGPAFHLNTRKRWDFTLTPVFGYALATYNATPIAAELVDDYEGKRSQTASGMVVGAELNFTGYFSGGLFISLGCDWTMNMIKLEEPYALMQPNGNQFFPGKSSSNIHHISFILSAGYAFSN